MESPIFVLCYRNPCTVWRTERNRMYMTNMRCNAASTITYNIKCYQNVQICVDYTFQGMLLQLKLSILFRIFSVCVLYSLASICQMTLRTLTLTLQSISVGVSRHLSSRYLTSIPASSWIEDSSWVLPIPRSLKWRRQKRRLSIHTFPVELTTPFGSENWILIFVTFSEGYFLQNRERFLSCCERGSTYIDWTISCLSLIFRRPDLISNGVVDKD